MVHCEASLRRSRRERPVGPFGRRSAKGASGEGSGRIMQRFLSDMFNGPIWRAFLLMGVFGGLSAITSYNLVLLFSANFGFVTQYGIMALKDGGLLQLAELVVYGYLSVAFYVLFKGCLYGVLGHFLKH
jgi:hypothetical protein